MEKICVLIVDGNPATSGIITPDVEDESWLFLFTSNGNEVFEIINTHMPDVIVLNTSTVEFDCFQLCRKIRESSYIPIIVIGTQNNAGDKVRYLDTGADEFLIQPLASDELIAHIRAVVRRSHMFYMIRERPGSYHGDIKISFDSRTVKVGAKEVSMTPTEFNLLQELVLTAGKVCTHDSLIEKVWGKDYTGEKTFLHTYIRRLRIKLESDPKNPQYLITVPGIGYMLKYTA
jgi:DNA-binding response OmpR family regulator